MANKKKGRTAEVACGFEGDLAAAQARLRAFTEEACRVLDAEQLNFASVSIAANLDGGAGERIARMKAELTAERSDVGIWWRELTRANADITSDTEATWKRVAFRVCARSGGAGVGL